MNLESEKNDIKKTTENRESVENHLLNLSKKRWSFKFSTPLEKEYKLFLNDNYKQTDKGIVLFGCFVFISFIWVDLVIFSQNFTLIMGVRGTISCILIGLVYLTFYKQAFRLDRHTMLIAMICSWIAIAGICIISYLLPNPYNLMYIIGVLPVLSGITASLRNSAYYVTGAVVGGCLMMTITIIINYFYGKHHPVAFVQEIMGLGSAMMMLFLWGVGLIAIYITFSIESNFRQQWLLMSLHEINLSKQRTITERFKSLSNLDELTNIANRRQLIYKMDDYLKQPCNQNHIISLVMMDIDYFKGYNDHYGHLEGDNCLKAISGVLSRNIQETNSTAARYGGEEFALFLPNTTLQQAKVQAENIRQKILKLEIPHIYGINNQVSASFGIASAKISEQLSIKALIHEADIALYQAKNMGRNRVEVFNNLE